MNVLINHDNKITITNRNGVMITSHRGDYTILIKNKSNNYNKYMNTICKYALFYQLSTVPSFSFTTIKKQPIQTF